MNRLFRFYNQNRRMFWLIIAIVIIVLGIIRALNNYAKTLIEEGSSINTTTYSAIYNNPDYSVITSETVSEKRKVNNQNTIDTFISYCNSANPELAYNLLSKDCKNVLYKTEQEFKEKYYNIYFNKKKGYKYQAWINETNKTIYRIEFFEDLLSTGGNSTKKQEDYYTVVNENGEYKLNINKYIGHDEINKQVLQDNIRITVLSKEIYLENVVYNFKVENFNEYDVSLIKQDKTTSIILTDSNDLKYTAATWENIQQNFVVYKKNIKNISIKFLREYKPQYLEETIEFNYIELDDGNNLKIKIDL